MPPGGRSNEFAEPSLKEHRSLPAAARWATGQSPDFLDLLKPDIRDRLLDHSTRAVLPAGRIFYKPGDQERVLIVTSGLVRVYTQDTEGRQATVLFAAEQSMLGVMNIFGQVPDVFAQAVIETSIVGLDMITIRQLVSEDVATANTVAAYLAARLRKTFELVSLRSLGSIRERLAYDLMQRARPRSAKLYQLEVRATQGELADSIGSSREVASRTLAGFKALGIVDLGRGYVRILDPSRLVMIVRDYVI